MDAPWPRELSVAPGGHSEVACPGSPMPRVTQGADCRGVQIVPIVFLNAW